MIDTWYNVLNKIFGPIIWPGYEYLSIIIFSVIISFVVTLFYKYLVDQDKVREIKQKQKEMQERIKELQKTNPGEAKKQMSEALKLTNKLMQMNFKPMMVTMIFVISFLPWMSLVFTGPVVKLPFDLPIFGSDFGWLMWYFINSIIFTTIFRKLLGVE